MRRSIVYLAALAVVFGMAGQAKALLIAGPDIIPAPQFIIDDPPGATNDHQQAFNERQFVKLMAPLEVDPGGVFVPKGAVVNSHMIFLNTAGSVYAMDSQIWTFDGKIIGVMSDVGGNREASSSALLGAPGTVYPAAFANRGLESNDNYNVLGNTIAVNMQVTEPGDWIRVITEVIEVSIDIKPGSDPNAINLKSKGVIPVAILGSATFDVTTVDVTTLSFGPAGAAPAHDLTDPDVLSEHRQDVNGDGYVDLVSHYRVQETGIAAGDTKACLTGLTVFNQAIKGCDAIVTVPKAAPSQGSRGYSATWGKIKSR